MVLATASGTTGEDPFGPGDPLEVARLVRRALADAGRKALDVTELVMVAHRAPTSAALARFARRALGPHGGRVPILTRVAMDPTHAARLARAITVAFEPLTGRSVGGRLVVAVVLGPDEQATALCLG